MSVSLSFSPCVFHSLLFFLCVFLWFLAVDIRVGMEVCMNPALHVTREDEDVIGWAQGSAIQRHVKQFNQTLDDFDLLPS